MIVNFTVEELKEKTALENKYAKLLQEAENKVKDLEPHRPDTSKFFEGLDPTKDSEKWHKAVTRENKAMTLWLESGSPEWHEARKHLIMLQDSCVDERNRFYMRCELRQFAELGEDPVRIEEDFKAQVQAIITSNYNRISDGIELLAREGGGLYQSPYVTNTGGGTWKLNTSIIKTVVTDGLRLYFDFCKKNDLYELHERFNQYINDSLLSDTRLSNAGPEAMGADAIRIEPINKSALTISPGKVSKLDFPIDKINNNVWNSLQANKGDGQYELWFDTVNSPNDPGVYYSLDFDNCTDLNITKKLLPFDKRVYVAIGSLFNAGHNVMTFSQIHYQMGYDKSPSAAQIKKLNSSILKMTSARIEINNLVERKITKNKYVEVNYKGSLLPYEVLELKINGMVAENALHIFREPPLITFARERKQITTINRRLLATPFNKTDLTIALEDYLIQHISWIKNDKKASKTLTLDKIYEKARAETRKQKMLVRQKLPKILEYYKDENFIASYSLNDKNLVLKV